jgi:competence protein ComEA
MKIYIPKEGEAAPLWQEAGSPPQALVDINRAGRAELMTLSGVGEATADAIISFREEHGPFAKIEDIMRVPGIKEGRFAKLKDRITTGYP